MKNPQSPESLFKMLKTKVAVAGSKRGAQRRSPRSHNFLRPTLSFPHLRLISVLGIHNRRGSSPIATKKPPTSHSTVNNYPRPVFTSRKIATWAVSWSEFVRTSSVSAECRQHIRLRFHCDGFPAFMKDRNELGLNIRKVTPVPNPGRQPASSLSEELLAFPKPGSADCGDNLSRFLAIWQGESTTTELLGLCPVASVFCCNRFDQATKGKQRHIMPSYLPCIRRR